MPLEMSGHILGKQGRTFTGACNFHPRLSVAI